MARTYKPIVDYIQQRYGVKLALKAIKHRYPNIFNLVAKTGSDTH